MSTDIAVCLKTTNNNCIAFLQPFIVYLWFNISVPIYFQLLNGMSSYVEFRLFTCRIYDFDLSEIQQIPFISSNNLISFQQVSVESRSKKALMTHQKTSFCFVYVIDCMTVMHTFSFIIDFSQKH